MSAPVYLTHTGGRRLTDISWRAAPGAGRRRPFADHFESQVGVEPYVPSSPSELGSLVPPALTPLGEWRQDVTIGSHCKAAANRYWIGDPSAGSKLDYVTVAAPGEAGNSLKRSLTRKSAVGSASSAPALQGLAKTTPSFRLGGGLRDGSFGVAPAVSPPRCATIMGMRASAPKAAPSAVPIVSSAKPLTPAQEKAWMAEQFKRWDVDKSGTLDEDELVQGARALGVSNAQAHKLFEAAAGSVSGSSKIPSSSPSVRRPKRPASAAGVSVISGESRESCLKRTAQDRQEFKPVLSLRQWVDLDRKYVAFLTRGY